MKRILGILTVAAIALPLCVSANSLSGYGVYWDTDDLDTGAGAGAKLKVDLFEVVSLDFRGSYVQFDDLDLDVIPVEAALALNVPLGEVLRPYGGAGVGYYFLDADAGSVDDAVGFFFVGGLELFLGEGVGLMGEIRYLFLESDVDDALETAEMLDDSDIDADGFAVNVGLFTEW